MNEAKLKIVIEMTVPAKELQEAVFAENIEQTAIILKSMILQGVNEQVQDLGAEDIKVTVTPIEE